MPNTVRRLAFADDHLDAILVEDVEDFVASGIVVNLTPDTILADGAPVSRIRPWRSLIATQTTIRSASRIAVVKVLNEENLGGVSLRGWTWFGDIYRSFPAHLPLYVSPVDDAGTVEEDPRCFAGEAQVAQDRKRFNLKLKCWWSPRQTDCYIHNEHPFLETHTQVYGLGRMQKFRKRDAATVYEDVMMAPGFTHEAFCTVSLAPMQFTYPWHRYYADEESIWLAVELHPQQGT